MRFFESPNPSPALSESGGPSGMSSPRFELEPVDRLLQEEQEVVEDAYTNMNEVLPGLWIGDIVAASDGEALKAKGITRVISVLRGSVPLTEGVSSQSIPVDDDSSADLLAHLPAAVDYIREALSDDVEGGVLVHCQAGMSRSATIVAAYLMSEHEISVEDALTTIRRARRCIQPSETFLSQLEIFGAAKYRVSNKDRVTREFYRDRVVTEVLNGDGSAVTSTHFAQYPAVSRRNSVTASGDSTPGTAYRRRKLRCGSCRRELALREHVLHATGTPAGTPPLSFTSIFQPSPKASRSPSITSVSTSPIASSPLATTSTNFSDSPVSSQPSTPQPSGPCVPNGPPETHPQPRPIPPAVAKARTKSMLAALSASLLSVTTTPEVNSSPFHSDDEDDDESNEAPLPLPKSTSVSSDVGGTDSHTDSPLHRRLSLSRLQLNPMTSLPPSAPASPARSRRPSVNAVSSMSTLPPPILTNTMCSGYFLEPMSWMDPQVATGQLAGRILCPNERCKAKIGSFDWAGSKCGCKEWITPAFCLHRAKVDDIAF